MSTVSNPATGEPQEVIWQPQAGSQASFAACPIFECLYEGTRGPGKTDALIMDFAQEVGKGYGAEWRGILFRRTYPELADVVNKTLKWLPQMFPGARFNKSSYTWTFPDGEELILAHARIEQDYWKYHGHAYPWIGWEELTNWPDDKLYRKMMSCCRSTNQKLPRKYRATCNPYGCIRSGEVLTEQGWVNIAEFQDGTKVLSVQPDGTARWSEATLVREQYSGQIIQYKTTRATIECTEAHRLPQVMQDRFELRPFNDLPRSEAKIKSAADNWEGQAFEFELPEVVTARKPKVSQPTRLTAENYAILMGWYLSEGCLVERDKAFNISQTKHRELLEADLDALGFRYSRQKTQVTVSSQAWLEHFRQFGKSRDKFIPKQLKEAPHEVLRLLLDRLMTGDGSWTTADKTAGSYPSYSSKLRDDVAEVCMKLGYRVRTGERTRADRDTPEYSVHFSPPSPFQLRPKTIGGKHFEGEVYCLSVPGDETFFVRQDGCVWLSGNTGHNWVKRRFGLPHMRGLVQANCVDADGNSEPPRVAIHGSIHENRILLDADPEYITRLRASARNKAELSAWLYGNWDIVAGGMFDDVWETTVHVVEPFNIPRSWRVDRSFDWGSAKPFSVGWWAESDGTDIVYADGRRRRTVRGDIYRIAEWYGCSPRESNVGLYMDAKDVAVGIKERELAFIENGLVPTRVSGGIADSAIDSSDNGPTVRSDMESKGCSWDMADKAPGSRKQGWLQMRKMLRGAMNLDKDDKPQTTPREQPGMFFFRTCTHAIELIPSMPRDDKDLDDVDTQSEDHIADEIRYRCRNKTQAAKQRSF